MTVNHSKILALNTLFKRKDIVSQNIEIVIK